MPFELNNNSQALRFFGGLKESMYEKVNKASKKSGLMRLTGPVLAMSSAVLTLSMRVAAVGEALIKGLANIFGSPFSKKCNALKGLKQIFIGLPCALMCLAMSPLEIGFEGLGNIVGMAVTPEKYAAYKKDVQGQAVQSLEKISEETYHPSGLTRKAAVLLYA